MSNIGFYLVLLAAFIFIVGFTSGYIFENVAVAYTNLEIDRMRLAVENMQLQEMFVSIKSTDCNLLYSSMGKLSYDLNSMVNALQ